MLKIRNISVPCCTNKVDHRQYGKNETNTILQSTKEKVTKLQAHNKNDNLIQESGYNGPPKHLNTEAEIMNKLRKTLAQYITTNNDRIELLHTVQIRYKFKLQPSEPSNQQTNKKNDLDTNTAGYFYKTLYPKSM